MTTTDVFITGLGKFFPGAPIGNDEMEDYLGRIHGRPARARSRVLAQKMGAKRYPSGWLDFDAARWKAHYGEMWPRLQAWKKRFDPDRVLNPGLLPLEA